MEEVFVRWGTDTPPQKAGQVHGPLDGDTFAEDFDLSLSVLSLGAASSTSRTPFRIPSSRLAFRAD